VTESARAKIPFNRPALLGDELEYVADAFRQGHISGDGAYTRRAAELLERELGTSVLLTTSCTHALEMAALLLNVEAGDEVILPAFTFTSTVNAFVLRGASPIFVDIRPDTLNIDTRDVARRITPRTKVIVPVHYAGVGCDMDPLMALAGNHNVAVVEDNAHGLFGTYRGRLLGTFGSFATLSFHETKNFTCGEGGALMINDARFHDRAEIVREKGTNRSRFFRGEIDKYGWVDVGSSYVISDILAAVLFAQLQKRHEVQSRRRDIWTAYAQGLAGWATANQVSLPFVPAGAESAYHLFHMLMPSARARQDVIAHLKRLGISAVFHYLPLNRSVMAERLGAVTECPVAEDVSDRLVRLPFFTTLRDDEVATVIDAVQRFTVG
jgi:dTDP-4-amino-4,6-dideoxygalactose transaminase